VINFRFHLVSLVAVFLALGVGVAMGASFVDRATVDTLRGRLDQLEGNYRERGQEIDDLHDHLRRTDERTAALLGEGSAAVAERLAGRNVAVVAPSSTPPAALDAAWSALEAAGAVRSGTLRVEEALALEDEAVLEEVRTMMELDSATPALVRGRVLDRLAGALAAFTATEPTNATPPEGTPTTEAGGAPTTVPPTTTTTEPPFRPLGPAPTTDELADARSLLLGLADAGLITLDTDGVRDGQDLPSVDEVTYVVLLPEGTEPEVVADLQRLAGDLAEVAPATVTVAETGVPREPGELPSLQPDRVGGLLVELRSDDDAVERLSTVDGLQEPLGRLTLVLAVEEQLSGRVGHYGTGVGATGTVPRIEG